MYFRELRERLIGIARERVHAGELTERALARLCGISQPHMHNVFSNVRVPSVDTTDRLLRALDMRVPDLLWNTSSERNTGGLRAIPLARNRIGPGSDALLTGLAGHYPFPESLVCGLVDPLAARLSPDLLLPRTLAARDLVLLDQNPRVRSAPSGDAAVWVVRESAGLSVRYLRISTTHLFLSHEAPRPDAAQWRAIPLASHNILDIVRARIVWIGREMEKEPPGPADPVGPGHRGDR